MKKFFLPYLYALYSGIHFFASISGFFKLYFDVSHVIFLIHHSLSFNGPFSKQLALLYLVFTSAPFEDDWTFMKHSLLFPEFHVSFSIYLCCFEFPQIIEAFEKLFILFWSIADKQC